MSLPSSCPLCKKGVKFQNVVTSHVYGSDNNRAFFKCNNCSVIYQFPRLTKLEEKNFYKKEFEKYMSSRSGEEGGWNNGENHIVANEETRKRRMKYLGPYLNKKSNLLEIGCSSGFMLYPIILKEINCIGIEPSGVFSKFCKSKNLEVYETEYELKSLNPNVKFDIIIHFFVLEHIVNPINFLKRQLDMLNKGGKIIFEIPSYEDPLYTIYDIPEFENFFWSIAHPWYFNENSIKYLLKQLDCEFEIKLDQRYDLSNHLVWMRDGKPGGMKKFTKSLGIELENFYKKTLIKKRKTDTIIGILTKN